VTGAWKQISKQRRRVNVSYDSSMVTTLQHGTWMDEEGFKKTWVAGNTPTASFLTKIGKMQSAGCRLCRIAREARGESTDGLAAETHSHINSAGCEGMATTVTATHHSIWRHLHDSMRTSSSSDPSLIAFCTPLFHVDFRSS